MRIKNIYPKLNNVYIFVYYNSYYFCMFIKVSEKGFNFINLNNNKLIFKKNLYPHKYHKDKFTVPSAVYMFDGFYYIDKKYEKVIRKIKLKKLLLK